MRKTACAFVLIILMIISSGLFAQSVAINNDGSAADASSILDVKSNSKGFLAPRMTATERGNISDPATGLLVYQTDGTAGYYYFNGSVWTQIGAASGSTQWTTSGSDIYYNTGNVGIGTGTPDKKLTVNGYMGFVGSTDNRVYFGENDFLRFDDATGNGLKFIYDDVERLRISNDGRLIVKGTYAQPQMLVGHDGSNGLFLEADGSSDHYNWKISQQNQMDGGLTFAPSTAVGGTTFASPVLSIKYNGNVGIGTTTPGGKLQIAGFGYGIVTGIGMTPVNDTEGGHYITFHNAVGTGIGSIARGAGNSVAYNTSSDYRLKENVVNISANQAITRLMALRPVEYNYISDQNKTVISGFLAHEMADAGFANGVTGEKDAVDKDGKPIYQAIDTKFIIPEMVKVIQEQQQMIEAQHKAIEAQQQQIDKLEKLVKKKLKK